MGFLWDIYNSVSHEDFSEYRKYSSQIMLPELSPTKEIRCVSHKKQDSVADFIGNNSRI